MYLCLCEHLPIYAPIHTYVVVVAVVSPSAPNQQRYYFVILYFNVAAQSIL